MGPRNPRRAVRTRWARVAAVPVAALLLLTGCSADSQESWERLGVPEPVTEQGVQTLELWQGAWIAALVTGVIVWGLIFWAVLRYRRRSEDEIPIQTRYNLPLEIFYTVAPIIMVVVFFAQTLETQEAIITDTEQDHTVNVVGQQWSWTLNYTGEDAVESPNVYTVGTASEPPTLVLPVDSRVQFTLYSPDVVHDFGVPGWLRKLDVIPGRINTFEVTPTEEGTFRGKCYELCGTYHSRMLFNVEVVSEEEFDAYLRDLEAQGNASEEPVLGSGKAYDLIGVEGS